MRENIFAIVLLLISILVVFYMTCFTRITPGEIGVVVNQLGNKKGVEEQSLNVGINFLAPWKTVYKFPTFDQNHIWENITFQTSEGLQVGANIGITFSLQQDKIHILFAKYRRGIDEITDVFIKNHVRDAINIVSSKMKVEDLYGEKKEEFFTKVRELLSKEVASIGFDISKVYIIGNFIVPDVVTHALNRKIEAIQKAEQRENELRETEAEAKKQIAKTEGIAKSNLINAKLEAEAILIKANAEAIANEKIAKSLTPQILKIEYIKKWNGVLPKVSADKDFIVDVRGE